MTGQPRVAVLGPVLVESPAGDLDPLPGALARTFIAVLVLARGNTATTETLIDELWGDTPPKGARAALQTLVSRVRRSTVEGVVASTGTGYRLALDPSALDLGRAEQVAGRISDELRTDPAGAARRASAVLATWRGEPGADLEGPVAEELADRAATVQRTLRRALAQALSACDDPDGAARLWEQEVVAHPFDEAAVAGHMRALVAAGRGAEALTVFAGHRDRLAEELGADPSADLVRLNIEILRATSTSARSVRRLGLRRSPTTLIGRDAEVEAVERLVEEERLVTVLGAGGLGKTRLAQEVAGRTAPDVAVVVLELASLTDGADIVPALGAVLGIAELRAGRSLRDVVLADLRSRVLRALGEAPTLLVLDNCEHVVGEVAALVVDLLGEVPSLRVLTTSRAPLAVPGEVVAPLPPLPVEADGAAVRLFTERARAARPGAVLPVDAVRRICARLDGSPLAIELAAARVRGMSVDEIERRLDDRFALLRGGDRTAPERHRTLLAVIEWSWRLLDDGAQDLLTRLALFPDGVAVEAVEAVVRPDRVDTALDDLAELVEQSLVQLTEREGEPARYRLLETVREFGAARLTERGTTEDVRTVMIRWGAAHALDRNVLLAGPGQRRVFREVEREVDNLVALLRWSLGRGDHRAIAPIAAALGTYWSLRGVHGEVVAIAPDVVAALAGGAPDPDLLLPTVVALTVMGASSAFTDLRTAAVAVSALRRLRRQHGPTGVRLADAQAELFTAIGRADLAMAALARLRDDDDPEVACFALTISAPLAENAGDVADALRYARRAEALASAHGDLWTAGTADVSRVQLLTQTGHPEEALVAADRARERLQWFGADDDLAEISWSMGLAAAAAGQPDRARAVAVDLDLPRPGARLDDDGLQFRTLAFAVRAEAARAEGDVQTALEEYDRGFAYVRDHMKQAPQWTLMVAAARIAIDLEARERDGGAPRLPDDGRATEAARVAKVGALVAIRIGAWWLDLPVIGDALIAVALWGATTQRVEPGLVAAIWGTAVRVGARQDLAVLRYERVRGVLARWTGRAALADAETASAGLDRAEAVARARALLEQVRVPRRAEAQAFRM
ncbi:hypothetical protein DEI92_01880 [Curtobacterium sp. MCBD17_034]|uniref:BTAD domain-containing putative transcriptional regulator n=1 Tax=unclassified Curtobacterium TaxID=257496 RepID=UPI000DA84F3F|nr:MULTISPECIES: BTAD domain-containing putative transcriptional regulator [unclassified Curtobacterium]PZF62274.1 hypothetical protein DEI92_01880 [Curtobacterium sp. MCBD17_034]PZM40019.1 hypothetical protein DEI90_04225 [Curtobacterium sp. MCBD17_031]